MKVRTYTFFLGDDCISHSREERERVNKICKALPIISSMSEVRTSRVTLQTITFSDLYELEKAMTGLKVNYDKFRHSGVRWVNQPIVYKGSEGEHSYAAVVARIVAILVELPNLFVSIRSTGFDNSSVPAKLYASICKSLSRADSTGGINFRFGIGFEIVSGTPYYPFSYSSSFGASLGIESLPVVVREFDEVKEIKLSDNALDSLSKCYSAAEVNLKSCDIPLLGGDWSLAPIPHTTDSVAQLIENQGYTIGSSGALSIVGRLTAELKGMASDERVIASGFNGVMLSVLEDDLLARRFSEGAVTVNDLIMYSSVCGVGVDMVPIPGETSEATIAGVALDLAMMASRLNKPLGLRLLPIQGKRAGAVTHFNHDFLNDTCIQGLF
ncbi:DUF711 family protein [Vibrio marisflavi]|uniref:DUF711 family protein n=1 Tax=Vibrio marisflavi CECT 7928 TaxID=634439 RepID=A0ABN8E8G8_9VIBR|nr:DUF711 family protein [Vibrio marisflavi]CAH0541765.1 hypothetical protein VMF7928_03820 [Vibrio marisflavi CECT 7928]